MKCRGKEDKEEAQGTVDGKIMIKILRRKWDEHATRMNAERIIKISRDNIPTGKFLGRPKRRWSDLNPG